MARTQAAPADSLRVGDRVTSKVPGFNRKGTIIENFGATGVGGRQIFLVHVGDEDEGGYSTCPPTTSNA